MRNLNSTLLLLLTLFLGFKASASEEYYFKGPNFIRIVVLPIFDDVTFKGFQPPKQELTPIWFLRAADKNMLEENKYYKCTDVKFYQYRRSFTNERPSRLDQLLTIVSSLDKCETISEDRVPVTKATDF